MRYLDREKYNVEVRLVSDSDEDFPITNRVVRAWLLSAVQAQGMQWYKLSDLTAELGIFKRCLRQKVDIIHYLDGEHSAQLLPRIRSLCRQQPKLVATYHQPPKLLDSLILKDVVARLDCITVVSPEQVAYFSDFVTPEKICLILHGIDTTYFRPGSIREKNGKFKCITVGHYLRDYDALRKVARALSGYREIEFNVVSSQATQLEGLTNVTVYSGIDDASLLVLYQQADILFLPLVQSTANNAILEGIACGLPVVSTDLKSLRAYLPGQEAILIKDNDPDQFVDTILHLAHDMRKREKMGREARYRAEELDWRKIAPQFESVYSDLISV